jgi:phosphomannomutase
MCMEDQLMSNEKITCFKAYDVRGQVPRELNEALVRRIGQAYAAFVRPKRVIVGRDIRPSSAVLTQVLAESLTEAGVDVEDIGLCGAEEVYFATFHERADGGVIVTASHNPPDYNGLKFIREEARPISGDTGLEEIRALAEKNEFEPAAEPGHYRQLATQGAYVDHLLGFLECDALKKMKIVVNAGNGGAGPVVDALEPHLPFEFVKINHQPDGSFPNGVPNPLLPENRAATSEAVEASGAGLGIAWDGDFDRCFLFDETGAFIEGYYIVGLLAGLFLERQPGEKIVHDPRLIWNTIDIVKAHGGTPIQSKAGHAFIKERMRKEDALYGGEMSAHHYFRDFCYCDSGMIPWLLVTEIMSRTGIPLSELVAERQAKFPVSGEINRTIGDVKTALQRAQDQYAGQAEDIDFTDGLSMAFAEWRFNLRPSNTEPLVRLNVETRGDAKLLKEKTAEVLKLLES